MVVIPDLSCSLVEYVASCAGRAVVAVSVPRLRGDDAQLTRHAALRRYLQAGKTGRHGPTRVWQSGHITPAINYPHLVDLIPV